MDIRPVTRASALAATALWLVWVAAVVGLLRLLTGRLAPFVVAAAVVAVVSAAIYTLTALRPRTRRDGDLETTSHGARCQGRVFLAAPVGQTVGLVERACREDPELRLRELTAHGGRVATGVSLWSWGESLRFAVRKSPGSGPVVEATCRPRLPFVVSDWGRSERILRRFLGGLCHESARGQDRPPDPLPS